MRPHRHFCLLLLALLFLAAAAAQTESPRVLYLAGIYNEVTDERWKDARIGFGASSILAQAFYESGLFIPVDDQEEIAAYRQETMSRMWSAPAGSDFALVDKKRLEPFSIDAIAYARILSAKRPGSSFSMGVMRSRRQHTDIEVEVSLLDRSTEKAYRARTKARATVAARAALFEIRKGRDGEVLFDETTVGKATKEALEKAVEEIIKDYRKGE